MPKSPQHYLDRLQQQAAEIVALRQDIHQHPELGFEEHRTSELVARCLGAWGYEVETGLGGTGVVGRLQRGAGTRRLGLRADMDALPIEERTGLRYASCRPGIMHACGHDGHTAMLLGAAKYLAEQGEFSGTLQLIFQPAEEGLGGAARMMAEGLFDKYPCDAVFAMHNAPGLPQGQFAFREGAMLSSTDTATITLTGIGGHGALPHKCADPLVAAAAIVMALQTVVARNVDPQRMAVVNVGALHAGRASNVVPESATMELCMRSMDPEVRVLLERRIRALVQAQADSFGVRADVDYRRGFPVLVNSPAETEYAREIGRELVGAAQVHPQIEPLSGSEDFSFMLERVPGSYLLIGNGADGTPGACMVHNPGFDFNDDNVALGGAYWALLAERFLRD